MLLESLLILFYIISIILFCFTVIKTEYYSDNKTNIKQCNNLQKALLLFSPILGPISFVFLTFVLLFLIILNLFHFSFYLHQKYFIPILPKNKIRDIETGIEDDDDIKDYLSIMRDI